MDLADKVVWLGNYFMACNNKISHLWRLKSIQPFLLPFSVVSTDTASPALAATVGEVNSTKKTAQATVFALSTGWAVSDIFPSTLPCSNHTPSEEQELSNA